MWVTTAEVELIDWRNLPALSQAHTSPFDSFILINNEILCRVLGKDSDTKEVTELKEGYLEARALMVLLLREGRRAGATDEEIARTAAWENLDVEGDGFREEVRAAGSHCVFHKLQWSK
jgi:hypothetical protein